MSKILATGENLYNISDISTRYLDSVLIGLNSGLYLENTNNVFIGQNAGYYSKTSTNCIFIGSSAGSYECFTNGNNNIILGDDINSKTVNDIISFGFNNSTDNNCISVGRYTTNKGLNNISIGFNNNIKGNNVLNYGYYNNITTSKVFYNNLINSNYTLNDIVNNVEFYNNKIKYYINTNNISIYTINIVLIPNNNNCNITINFNNNDDNVNTYNLDQILIINSENTISLNSFSFANINNIILNYENLNIKEFYIIDDSYINNNNFNIVNGCNVNIIGLNNIAIGNNFNITGNNSIVFGNNNSDCPISESIIIGNNNFQNAYANNAIVIGNNNINKSDLVFQKDINPIIIGNNINDTQFSLNINNIICKNDDYLIFNSPIAIGYSLDEINNANLNRSSLIIKNGIYTSNIAIVNNSNFSINIKATNNLKTNINYILPILPDTLDSVFLTTDKFGNLSWNEVGKLKSNNLSTNFLNANNIIANSISGNGYNISDINMSDKTTDDLKEGNNNLYYTYDRVSNVFDNKISKINSDIITQGNSNLYYTYDNINNLFNFFINNITSDNIKTGLNNYYLNNTIFSNLFYNNISNITTDNIKEGSSNLYYTYQRFIDDIQLNISNIVINNITSDNIIEGNYNKYYYVDQVYNDFYNIISKINTDIFIEGKNNKFYNIAESSLLISNIIKNITTDNIIQGKHNLYLNSNTFNTFLNLKSTDDIKEGSNLFFTQGRFLDSLNQITTDNIILGTSNLYYTYDLFYSNITCNITLDNIKQGTSNTFIVNNTINSDLIVKGIIYASNIIIKGSNLNDLYDSYVTNINSNNIKLSNYYVSSNININNSCNISINLNIYNNQSITFDKKGPPIAVIGSNVGMNNIIPKYNLDVYGITNSTYFKGNGSMIDNINLNDKTTDYLNQGNSNLYLTSNSLIDTVNYSNFYFNDIKLKGTLYTNDIVIGNDNNSVKNSGITIGGSNSILNLNYDLNNNNGITINHTAPPFIIVGNNVGVNNLTPKYNLDVSGYTYSDYFVGDGSLLKNIDLGSISLLKLGGNAGSINFIISNVYNSNLKIIGDLTVDNIYTNGNLIPITTNVNNIGTSSSLWRNLYLGGTINLDGILLKTNNNILEIKNSLLSSQYSGLASSIINIYNNNDISKFSTLSIKDDGSIFCFYNGDTSKKAISYNDLNNQIICKNPLYLTTDTDTNININLNIDPNKFELDSNNNNRLTLKLTKKIFTFSLTNSTQYPNLWYYLLPIASYSSYVTINSDKYYIFNIKSWTTNNIFFEASVWINYDKSCKKIIIKSSDSPDSINLGSSIFKTQGWQIDDNNVNNLIWFSNGQDTIYNIIEDIIS